MRYATANIQALPFNHDYRHGIDAVLAHADVVGWQEMTKAEYLHYLDSRKGWAHSPNGALSWRTTEWTCEKTGAVLLHPGTPAICPVRPITYALLSRLENPRRRVMVTTRHYVSSAWNHKPDPDKELRKGMWLHGNETDKGLLRSFVERGLPVVCMADGNRMNYPIWGESIGNRKVEYANGNGIDYLAFINGDHWTWDVRGPYSRNIPGSDHNARLATATLHDRNGA